jgi:hypothetical protein
MKMVASDHPVLLSETIGVQGKVATGWSGGGTLTAPDHPVLTQKLQFEANG